MKTLSGKISFPQKLTYGLVRISLNKVPLNVEKDPTIENCNINNTVASENYITYHK